jgi:protein-L-isoaspartate O-methyltransferase
MAEVATPIQDRSVERQRMVAFHVARRGITDQHVLEAMRQVPREAFVGSGMEEFAYEDAPVLAQYSI